MKKFVSVLTSALIIAGILAGCGSSSSNSTASSGAASSGSAAASSATQETYKVAIVQPMSHTSLDQIRDTIVARL